MDQKTQAIINQLVAQRNQAHDTVAHLCGEIAERDEKIALLQKELDSLKANPAPEPAFDPVTAQEAA
ncbi:MAG: hypothetical protein ACRECD_01160 [Burkholderiaceae bacterium]